MGPRLRGRRQRMWYFELRMGKWTIYEQISMNDSFVQNILENLLEINIELSVQSIS